MAVGMQSQSFSNNELGKSTQKVHVGACTVQKPTVQYDIVLTGKVLNCNLHRAHSNNGDQVSNFADHANLWHRTARSYCKQAPVVLAYLLGVFQSIFQWPRGKYSTQDPSQFFSRFFTHCSALPHLHRMRSTNLQYALSLMRHIMYV